MNYTVFGPLIRDRPRLFTKIKLGPTHPGDLAEALPRQKQKPRDRAKRPACDFCGMPELCDLFIGQMSVSALLGSWRFEPCTRRHIQEPALDGPATHAPERRESLIRDDRRGPVHDAVKQYVHVGLADFRKPAPVPRQEFLAQEPFRLAPRSFLRVWPRITFDERGHHGFDEVIRHPAPCGLRGLPLNGRIVAVRDFDKRDARQMPRCLQVERRIRAKG